MAQNEAASAKLVEFRYQQTEADECPATGIALLVRNKAGDEAIIVDRYGKQFFFLVSKENEKEHIVAAGELFIPIPEIGTILTSQEVSASDLSEEQIEQFIAVARAGAIIMKACEAAEVLLTRGFQASMTPEVAAEDRVVVN